MSATLRLLREISVPRLREHPLRTALTSGGVMLGVAFLISVVLINRSITRSLAAGIDDISGKADWQISAGPLGIDARLVDKVRAVAGVAAVAPVIQQPAQVIGSGHALEVMGVDLLGDDERFRDYRSQEIQAIKQDPISFLASSTNIILGEQWASRHGVKLHDTVTLLTPSGRQRFEVWGFVRDEKIGRALGGSVAVMYFQATQVAFERGHLVDRFDVALAPGAVAADVRDRLRSALGAGYEVERPERRGERVNNMLQGFHIGLVMGSLLALLVGMFLIYNTIAISVVQRKHEIGVLRALGATRRQVMQLFLVEGILLGVVGSALGVVGGLYLSRLLLAGVTRTVSELYLRVHASDVEVSAPLIATGFAAGIGAAVVSALWPAWLASRVAPVEALRTSNLLRETGTARHFGVLDGAAVGLGLLTVVLARAQPVAGKYSLGYAALYTLMLAVSCAMPRVLSATRLALRPAAARLFGVEGHLAIENLARDTGRSSITASALMIAMAMVISTAVFIRSFQVSAIEWIDQSVPGDLFVTSASPLSGTVKNVPMTNEMLPFLKSLGGVSAVERVRIPDLDYRDTQVKLLSLDWEITRRYARHRYLEGNAEEAHPEVMAGTGILMSENFARRNGFHVGDTVELSTPGGARRFRVSGVIIDYTSDHGLLLTTREVYTATWRDDRVDTFKLYLDRGADVEAVRGAIQDRYGARFNLHILTNAQLKGELKRILDQIFQLVDALQLVALIIAVLGVVNTMLAAVIDRIREIGIVRAVGGTRGQVRKMVIIESGVLGVASSAAGIGAGLLGGLIMLYSVNVVQNGWFFPFHLPGAATLRIFFLVVAAAVIGGWYPARVAARLPTTTALQYE